MPPADIKISIFLHEVPIARSATNVVLTSSKTSRKNSEKKKKLEYHCSQPIRPRKFFM